MKDVIDKYQVGISLDNDGSDIESIKLALDDILRQYDLYKSNVLINYVGIIKRIYLQKPLETEY